MNEQLEDLLITLTNHDINELATTAARNDNTITRLGLLNENYRELKQIYNLEFSNQINKYYMNNQMKPYTKIIMSMNKALIKVYDYQITNNSLIQNYLTNKIIGED